jgi:hypothetical protein
MFEGLKEPVVKLEPKGELVVGVVGGTGKDGKRVNVLSVGVS